MKTGSSQAKPTENAAAPVDLSAWKTPQEIAEGSFGGKVSRSFVYALARQGMLRSVKVGSRILIDPESVADYLAGKASHPAAAEPTHPARSNAKGGRKLPPPSPSAPATLPLSGYRLFRNP